ncbi:MAG: class I SAM-dependent methyltransferase [Acidobacteria bacterium]|nr:class I SAM-dependent methyltransferase [Acidobacteriota bacterium]
MGIYAKYIFPHLLDWALGKPELGKYRQRALEPAYGKVLEIGFGTGLNLPYYPAAVQRLMAIDSEHLLQKKLAQRIKAAPLPVEFVQLDASGSLPFADAEFDCIVTTWTLCSIAEVLPALAEMRRLLKPTRRYIFFEHGRSDDTTTARWQDRLNPVQKVIGVGCHINRPIANLISAAGFAIDTLDRFVLPKTPRLFGEMYRGTARRL